ncbi:MAG TPA: hypothetical protein VHF67_03770 [Gaiellaceae bacterium]|nr:hypothetical protein [Gaiellaceae bacterium]
MPLLLAAFPALERLDGADDVQAIVLVATAASVVAQGATRRSSRRASSAPKLRDPPPCDAGRSARRVYLPAGAIPA